MLFRIHRGQSEEMSQPGTATAEPSIEPFLFGNNMVLSPDMLEDWLFILSTVNAQRMKQAQEADDMV